MKNRNLNCTLLILISIILGVIGLSYASVPLYKLFCQVTGYGGTVKINEFIINNEMLLDKKNIIVHFNANLNDDIEWKFLPLQESIAVKPGETSIAFYKVSNDSSHTITGISTYNVYPQVVAPYFEKIECFCFEEQRLKSNEYAEMPVVFSINSDIRKDEKASAINHVYLSYTFFKVSDS